jgi:hypothetical protein
LRFSLSEYPHLHRIGSGSSDSINGILGQHVLVNGLVEYLAEKLKMLMNCSWCESLAKPISHESLDCRMSNLSDLQMPNVGEKVIFHDSNLASMCLLTDSK